MRLRFISALLGLGFAAAAINCSISSDAESQLTGSGGDGTPSGVGGGSDAGIDANLGDADPEAGPPDYGQLCGSGCIPGLDPDDCGPDGGVGGGVAAASACQLGLDDPPGALLGECSAPGQNLMAESCLTSGDCAGGLACVGEPGTGEPNALACRPYCCGPVEDCPEGSFCRPMPWSESPGSGTDVLHIPVCWPTSNCQLFDQSACPVGEVCAIVRVDGTTSCVVPGVGQLGDACAKNGDCSEGHVCSIPKSECMKLCRIGRAEDCDESFSCQGGSTIYPAGFGICVGGG